MKRLILKYGLCLILIAILPCTSNAQVQTEAGSLSEVTGSSISDVVRLKTAWSVDRAHPGEQVALAIIVDIKDGFHINADASQVRPFEDFKPYPTHVKVMAATEGLTIETARFPAAKPIKVDYSSGALMSFEGRAIIYLLMKLDEQIGPDILLLFPVVLIRALSVHPVSSAGR